MSHTLNNLLWVGRQSRTSLIYFLKLKTERDLYTSVLTKYYVPFNCISDLRYNGKASNFTMKYLRNRDLQTQQKALACTAEGNGDGVNRKWHTSVQSVEIVQDDLPVNHEGEDWTAEMEWIKSQESRSVLLPPKDESDIDVLSPELRPSFNLAAYVNKSTTLQELMKLGVDLSKWDSKEGINEFILKLDFELDMKKHIMFLHDIGVAADDLGRWLTRNPHIFKEPLDDLQVRVNYLESMKFSKEQITHIISKNPYWLLFSTVDIDTRLGFFQRSFELTGTEVRELAAKRPRLITHSYHNIKRTSFAVLEEMGFEKSEMKSLLLVKPKVWMIHGVSLLRRFDFAHNHMSLSHAQLVQFPEVLMSRDFRLKQRHGFLKLIGRDQYDPYHFFNSCNMGARTRLQNWKAK